MSTSVKSVVVRWRDGYEEVFEAEEARFGSDTLWMRLTNGKNRHIPLRHVRWFVTGKSAKRKLSKSNVVSVRWFDGCLEELIACDSIIGSDFLSLVLDDTQECVRIPLREVRWYGFSEESHQSDGAALAKLV